MAVVRPELTPEEMDFIVSCVDRASADERRTYKRAIRELKRQRQAAWAIQARELKELEKRRANLPTAPPEE